MPEREGVPGVETSALELVDATEVEIAEVDELAHAREMEQTVARDDPGDRPECDPEQGPEREDAASRTSGRWTPSALTAAMASSFPSPAASAPLSFPASMAEPNGVVPLSIPKRMFYT